MKLITIADIRALNPCYDPTRYAPETWSGTVADILRASNVPAVDRLLVARLLDDRTNKLFSFWCAAVATARAFAKVDTRAAALEKQCEHLAMMVEGKEE